jgi:hypothetical protein
LIIDQLINKEPSLIHQCILFLNWCEPNTSNYDIDAIQKLKPLGIISIIEIYQNESGAAGSEKYYEWYCHLPSCPVGNLEMSPYYRAHTIYLDPYPSGELTDIRLDWIHCAEKISQLPKINLPQRTVSFCPHREVRLGDCTLM